jgi:hypothetical protein
MLSQRFAQRLRSASQHLAKHREGLGEDFNWSRALKTYLLDEDDWKHTFLSLPDSVDEVEEFFEPELSYESPVKEKVARSQALPKLDRLVRDLDLDRRFQIRIASILKQIFPKLSRRTIAWLVVFVYVCAELAEFEPDGAARIVGSRRALSTGAVYDRIRRHEFAQTRDANSTKT